MESDSFIKTLISDAAYPVGFYEAGMGSAFTACNHPIDASEIEIVERP